MPQTSPEPRRRLIQFSREELALIGITMIWGVTFLVVHLAMRHSGPLFFVGVRFVLAGIIVLALSSRILSGLTRRELLAGSLIGICVFLGYGLQTVGLQTISSSQSAFITALYVPLVPLVQWAIFRRPPGLTSWIGVALAFIGLLLLTGPGSGDVAFGRGEIATMLGTFAIAVEIVLIGSFAQSVDSRRVTIVQLLVCGLLSFAAMPLTGEAVPAFSWLWLLPAVGLGFASALIQLVMNWAQKKVSPTRATIIYAGEPVWAGLIGRLAGDRLPALALLGAAFIVAGVLASELKPASRRSPED